MEVGDEGAVAEAEVTRRLLPRAGPLLTGVTAPAAAAAAGAAPTTLKVLSHNVWGHYVVGGMDVSGRLKALAESVARERYDVVLLQELFLMSLGPLPLMGYYVQFAADMEAAGLVYMTDPRTAARRWMQNHGLVRCVGVCVARQLQAPSFFVYPHSLTPPSQAVFSRYPIVEATLRSFPRSAEPLNAKGVAVVTVEVAGEVFHLGDFHPDSRNRASRAAQVAFVGTTVRDHLAKVRSAGPPTNLLVAGDTNVCAKHAAEYAHMSEVMAGVGAPIDLFPGDDDSTMPDEDLWLDHMYVTPTLRDRLLSKRLVRFKTPSGAPVSDHLGLEAVFSLRGGHGGRPVA